MNTNVFVSMYMLHYHFMCFNSEERGHSVFGFVFLNTIIIGFYVKSIKSAGVEGETFTRNIPTMVLTLFMTFFMILSENSHSELITKTLERVQHHHFLKLVLDNGTSPMIILSDDSKLSYSNPIFRTVFKDVIQAAIDDSKKGSSITIDTVMNNEH